jgi:hypothetical protein
MGIPTGVAPHESRHVSGGADALLSTDIIEAIVKRLQETSGPTTLALGAIANGEYLKRSGSSIVGGSGGSTTFPLQAPTGLGAVAQFLGPTDEPLIIRGATASDMAIQLAGGSEMARIRRSISLTNNTTTTVISVNSIAGNTIFSGILFYTIRAGVAGAIQARSGMVTFSAVSDNGTTVTAPSPVDTGGLTAANGGSSLTVTWSAVTGSSTFSLKVNANSSGGGGQNPLLSYAFFLIDNQLAGPSSYL